MPISVRTWVSRFKSVFSAICLPDRTEVIGLLHVACTIHTNVTDLDIMDIQRQWIFILHLVFFREHFTVWKNSRFRQSIVLNINAIRNRALKEGPY